jgi:hypothetical protein
MRCGVARYARRDWRRPRDGRADAHGASVKLLAQAQERWGALGQADRRAHRGQACLDRRCRERRDGGKASALGRGDRPSSADTPRRHRRGGCCGHQEDSCDCCPVAGAQARRARRESRGRAARDLRAAGRQRARTRGRFAGHGRHALHALAPAACAGRRRSRNASCPADRAATRSRRARPREPKTLQLNGQKRRSNRA